MPPTTRTNATPMVDNHPSDHTVISQALTEIINHIAAIEGRYQDVGLTFTSARTTVDAAPPNVWSGAVGFTWNSAPRGYYIVDGVMVMYKNGAVDVNVDVQVNGVGSGHDYTVTVPAVRTAVPFSHVHFNPATANLAFYGAIYPQPVDVAAMPGCFLRVSFLGNPT